MSSFSLGHSSATDWEYATGDCLAQLDRRAGSLGFLYATDPFAPHLDAILKKLKEQTGVSDWVGTVGLGICCTGTEYYEQPALTTLVTDLDDEHYRLIAPIHDDLDDFNRQNKSWIDTKAAMVGVVHADPHNPRTPELVQDLSRELNHGFLVGGLTSAQRGSPQISGDALDGGLSGVIFAGDVAITTGLSQGCTPLAPAHEITQCQGNVLIALDGRPALDVFSEDIGELLARNINQIGGYIFAGLPVSGSDTGDYLVRNLLGVDQERKLIAVAENLVPGQTIMFCRRDNESARTDLERMLADIQNRSVAPRGGIYISCLARGRNMFGDHSAELKLIEQTLGDVPLVGFFANGEICHDRLYGYTGVLTLFG